MNESYQAIRIYAGSRPRPSQVTLRGVVLVVAGTTF